MRIASFRLSSKLVLKCLVSFEMESRKRKISSNQENLSGRMLELFMSDNYSDVVFIVEEQRIPAHRQILAAGNKYFQGLLYGGLLESNQKEIELKVPLEAFKAVLRYIYTGQICLPDLEEKTVMDTLALGHMYDFAELVRTITEYLKQIVTLDNVLAIFKMALRFELEGLKGACHAFMDRNASVLFAHESFKEFPKELLQEILARDSFLAPEFEIFAAVTDWSKANPDVDVDPLLSCVRLPLMSVAELSKVRKSGLIEVEALMDRVEERDASGKLPHRVLPGENMVSFKYRAKIIKGLWVMRPPPPGDIFPCDLEDTSASSMPAAIRSVNFKEIVVELGITSFINHIEMRLRGTEEFSYFVEISTNQSQWERVVDYKNCFCRNLQSLYFPAKTVKYIKLVGTKNDGLGIAVLKATYTEIMPKQVNGFQAATIEICGTGVEKGPILKYSNLCSSSEIIQLDQPYLVGLIRLHLSNYYYPYRLEVDVSTDRFKWSSIIKETFFASSQNISFTPCPIVFIKISCDQSVTTTSLMHYINFEE